jgi:hypothetical protein
MNGLITGLSVGRRNKFVFLVGIRTPYSTERSLATVPPMVTTINENAGNIVNFYISKEKPSAESPIEGALGLRSPET